MRQKKRQPIYSSTYRRRFNWNLLWLLFMFAILTTGIYSGVSWWNHRDDPSNLRNYQVQGVSLNQDNGYVDFQALADAKYQFVYLKATSGATYSDDNFASNYSRVQGTKMQVGVYQVFSFSSSAIDQFNYFVSQVGSKSGNLPIMIQVSYYDQYAKKHPDASQAAAKLQQLIEQLSRYYDRDCIVWVTDSVNQEIIKPYLSEQKIAVNDSELRHQPKTTEFIQYQTNGNVELNGQQQQMAKWVYNGKKPTFTQVANE